MTVQRHAHGVGIPSPSAAPGRLRFGWRRRKAACVTLNHSAESVALKCVFSRKDPASVEVLSGPQRETGGHPRTARQWPVRHARRARPHEARREPVLSGQQTDSAPDGPAGRLPHVASARSLEASEHVRARPAVQKGVRGARRMRRAERGRLRSQGRCRPSPRRSRAQAHVIAWQRFLSEQGDR